MIVVFLKENMTSTEEIVSHKKFEITPQHFRYLCRTCLKMDKVLVPTSSLVKEKDAPVSSYVCVMYLLKFCLSLEIMETDFLPKQICIECINMLMKIYHFRNQCNQNQNKLKLVLENIKIDVSSNKFISKYGSNTDSGLVNSDITTEDQKMLSRISTCDEDGLTPAAASSDTFVGILDNCSDVSNPGIDVTNDANTDKENKFSDPNKIYYDLNSDAVSESECDGQSHPPKINKSNKFKCIICNDIFPTKKDLRKHSNQLKHSQVDNKKCQMCEKCGKLVPSSGLKQHIFLCIHTNEKPYICKKCKAAFRFRTHLRRHMMIHSDEKPYICKECKAAFRFRANLRRHMIIHSEEKRYICEFCGKGFNRIDNIKKHYNLHSNKMNTNNGSSGEPVPTLCDICGREFKTIEIYRRHVKRTHQENLDQISSNTDNPNIGSRYCCDVCDKSFKSKQLLRQHGISHGEKSHLCTECGKAFIRKANLDDHFRTHSGERPYKCKICSKDFTSSNSYKTHMNIHLGFKRYTCKVCNKRFTQHSHLTYHLRTHSGERPYSCSFCGKSFSVKGTLTVHLRIHTGDRPYICPDCGKGFYDTSSRKKHCKKSHNVDL